MKSLIENIVRWRNPGFHFDSRVTSKMIVEFAITQVIAVMRGMRMYFFLRAPKGLLLGQRVRFQYLSKIKWGKFVKLGDYVCISGLGKGGVIFGDHVGIGAYSRVIVSTSLNKIGESIRIESNVGIGEYAYLGGGGGLTIGEGTIVGQYFSCHPENHVYKDSIPIRHQDVERCGIVIGRNCWIGSKVTVLDNVTIGDDCVVAAGAVVTKSFPGGSVLGGVPAKIIKTRSK